MPTSTRIRRAGAPLKKVVPRTLEPGESVDIVGHLGELRTRLFFICTTLVLTFAVAYAYHKHLISWLNAPLPDGLKPITIGVAEPFMTSIKVSLYASLAMSFPVILWQMWGFIIPAIAKEMRSTMRWFVLFGTILFLAGGAAGYLWALPSTIQFLTGFDHNLYNVQIRAQDYYVFAAAVLVALGLVAQLPIVLLGMIRFQLLSSAKLRRNRKIAYVALTALAVALPGVDPVVTAMELIPLGMLFEVTIVIASVLEKRWDKARAQRMAEYGMTTAA